jgi:S-ribosylhomocysteine lyase LuxS involved in autoinducer biosynthesis
MAGCKMHDFYRILLLNDLVMETTNPAGEKSICMSHAGRDFMKQMDQKIVDVLDVTPMSTRGFFDKLKSQPPKERIVEVFEDDFNREVEEAKAAGQEKSVYIGDWTKKNSSDDA